MISDDCVRRGLMYIKEMIVLYWYLSL